MALPLPEQGFIVKASNQPQALRARQFRNVLPFFVALQNLPRGAVELLVNAPVLFDAPQDE